MASKNSINIKKLRSKTSGPAVFIGILIVICGCAERYGSLQRSDEVNRMFKTYRILDGYIYYYSGPEGRPDAIMGIQDDYTLQTTQWTPLNTGREALKKGVNSINFYHSNRSQNYPYGFHILGPEGQQLGIWYSIWDWTTIILEEDNRLRIFPPAVDDPFGNGEKQEIDKND